jgi:hypothetical protein
MSHNLKQQNCAGSSNDATELTGLLTLFIVLASMSPLAILWSTALGMASLGIAHIPEHEATSTPRPPLQQVKQSTFLLLFEAAHCEAETRLQACPNLGSGRRPGAAALDDRGVAVRVEVGSRMFLSPYRPDRLWGPPNILTRGSLAAGKATGARSWRALVHTSTPHTSSWRRA